MSISVAYCPELDQNLTISDVRREYFSKAKDQRKKFDLRCSDPNCLQPNGERTQISAINAYEDIFEPRSSHAMVIHFRRFSKQKHHDDCIWQSKNNDVKNNNTSTKTNISSLKKEKMNTFINVFHRPKIESNRETQTIAIADEQNINDKSNKNIDKAVCNSGEDIKKSIKNSQTSTRFLDVLVDSYLEARRQLATKEITQDIFDSLTFRIPNESTYHYKYFFRNFHKAYKVYRKDFGGVSIGNCWANEGNQGWFLNFYDSIDDKKVVMLLSNELFEHYRYRHNLLDIIKRRDKAKYIKAYFMNPIYQLEDNRIFIKISNLENLVLHLGTKK